MKNTLTSRREEIDRIDSELIALLCRRMDCVAQISACKQASGLPVTDSEREQIVRQTAVAQAEAWCPGYGAAAETVMEAVMAAARQWQQRACR